jgi:type II secretory pathway pseudopilin PulG
VRPRSRWGKVPVGFLATLAVIGILIYLGIAPARGYIRYYQMKDEMQVQARFASNATDADIRRRLRTKASELGLPADAQRITVRRRGRPREITVSTSWTDTVSVFLFAVPITYRPQVRAPL